MTLPSGVLVSVRTASPVGWSSVPTVSSEMGPSIAFPGSVGLGAGEANDGEESTSGAGEASEGEELTMAGATSSAWNWAMSPTKQRNVKTNFWN